MSTTQISLYEPQFTQADLCEVAAISNPTANNWILRGVTTTRFVTQRDTGGRRMFSFAQCVHARMVAECTDLLRMAPNQAKALADYAMDRFGEVAQRGPDGKLTRSSRYLVGWYAGRLLRARIVYGQPGSSEFFETDPTTDPAARKVGFPLHACVVLPIDGITLEALEVAEKIVSDPKRAAQ